jgi:Na+-translocating ferredoxin:NAD+ oxidoreductase subunit G
MPTDSCGAGLPGAARGYQDVIQFLFGYDPECECIIGSKVLKSTETPGAGGQDRHDPVFLENFVALDASLNPEGTGLANPIVLSPSGTKTEPWQIDGISGATISGKAMARARPTMPRSGLCPDDSARSRHAVGGNTVTGP